MTKLRFGLVAVLCSSCVPATIMADEFMIFPNNNQTAEQLDQDKYDCYNWAKNESGFDPMAPPTATEPPPQQAAQKGGAGRGLVRGAAVGAVFGSSSSDTKKAAGAGMAIGGMRRQDQKRKEQQAREQWEREQTQIYTENRNRYNRGYAACLEGKNYTVR